MANMLRSMLDFTIKEGGTWGGEKGKIGHREQLLLVFEWLGRGRENDGYLQTISRYICLWCATKLNNVSLRLIFL
jgi:hypothetical protein